MDWLRREGAPLSERVWKAIEEAMVRSARQELAGRRIADFEGPRGWDHVAEPLGTRRPGPRARSGAVCSIPDVMLLCEIRKDFSLPWATIDGFERGGRVLDTIPAEHAAREVALAEDDLAFYGGPGSSGFLGGDDGLRVSSTRPASQGPTRPCSTRPGSTPTSVPPPSGVSRPKPIVWRDCSGACIARPWSGAAASSRCGVATSSSSWAET
jgi:uncharacterized linocin/CFP29 family protein